MMGEVIRVSGRAPDVGVLLREAMASRRFADVALCCSGGHRFLAHRLVLSAASPYLREVLLAHGKAAGYCEPITMILAEVEGPELAAILSFVYTGSATVPRCRLQAFTRAAETLHVRIAFQTLDTLDDRNFHQNRESDRFPNDWKRDNIIIEGTKVDGSYQRCEQYPSYDKCSFDSTTWTFENCLKRLQQTRWTIQTNDRYSQTILRSIDESSNNPSYNENFSDFEINRRVYNDNESSPDSRTSVDHRVTNDLPIADFFADSRTKNRESSNGSREFDVDDRNPGDIVGRIDRDSRSDGFHGFDDSVSRMSGWQIGSNRPDGILARVQREGETRRDNNDFEAELSGEARRVPASTMLHDRTTGRSSVTFEKRDYDAAATGGRSLEADGTPAAATSATVTSGIADEATSPRVADCRESCCRWRSTRRHVANRVPASPWSQLARPAHHSPKVRTIVHRNRDDNNESVRHRWNESNSLRTVKPTSESYPRATTIFDDNPTEPASPSAPLNLHHDIATVDSSILTVRPYDYQVPKPTTEITLSTDANVSFVDDPRIRANFYDSTFYQRSMAPVYAVGTITNARYTENPLINEVHGDIVTSEPAAVGFYDDAKNLDLRSMPEASDSGNPDRAQGVNDRHAISIPANNHRRTVDDPLTCNQRTSPPRIELSHPISRLCDSVSLNGDTDDRDETLNDRCPAESVETIEVDDNENRMFEGKTILPLAEGIVHSDNNNNEANVDGSTIPRNLTNSTDDVASVTTGTNQCSAIPDDHRCDQCGKTFVTRASLKVHGRTHSGEKPFRCDECGKQFSQLRNYKYHRSIHEGTREFAATCPECGKYFNDRGYLSSHLKIHRNRKEYACAVCGKSFNQRVAYNMHVRIHTGVKPHQCEQCGKAFSRKMLLKQHLRTHSGERPYQCQICNKAFADRSNMTLHTRLHSGLKPYQCTLCSKAFTKKHHLKTHLNYHTGTKPYSCSNCNLRFSQSSNMRTHYKKCVAMTNINATDQRVSDDNDVTPQTNVINRTIETNDCNAASGSSSGRTNALTPPSSDQESSINVSMSDKIYQTARTYSTMKPEKNRNYLTDI